MRKIAVSLEQLLLLRQLLPALPRVDRGLERGQAGGVAERRDVARVAGLDERADHAADVFAAPRLGELGDLDEVLRHGDRALLAADEVGQAALVVLAQFAAGRGDDEGERGQPLLAVRRADDQDVADGRVGVERLVAQDRPFDLLGPHAVAADVDDVVRAAVEREAAVVVAHGKVALRVRPCAGPAGPVAVAPAGGVAAPAGGDGAVFDREAGAAPHRAGEIGVGGGDDDLALLAGGRAAVGDAAG